MFDVDADEHTEKFLCRKFTCTKVCKRGKSIIGISQLKCTKSTDGAKWSDEIGKCSGCAEENPKPNDPSYVTEIF